MASRKVVLSFPQHLIDEPIICRLVKEYGLEFNILRASISPRQQGTAVLELMGDSDQISAGLESVQSLGVQVDALKSDVTQNEDKCTHCGACIVICPTGSLSMNRETWFVEFDGDKCIACELCVPVCPPRAMEVRL